MAKYLAGALAAGTLALALAVVLTTAADAIADARRRRWQQQRDQLHTMAPRPFPSDESDSETLSLDSLRGRVALRTDERAIFNREGGFTVVPKKRKKPKHGRKRSR